MDFSFGSGFAVEKLQCCVMLPEDYQPVDELMKYATPINDAPAASSKPASGKPIKDYVTKVFGIYDVTTFAKNSFSKIEKELKSLFGKDIVVHNLSTTHRMYDVYNPSIKVNGRQPYKINFSKSKGNLLLIDYDYSFKFDSAAEAKSFAQSLKKAVEQQCGFRLNADSPDSKDELCSYIEDYHYKNIEYSVLIMATKQNDGDYLTSLGMTIFFH